MLKQRIKRNLDLIGYSPTEELLDETLIRNAIWECLKNNDSVGVMEVLDSYLEALSKDALCERMEIARSTLYHSLRVKNPTLKTLAKLVSAVHAKPN